MSDKAVDPVTVRLIDREFLIACAPEERDDLLDASVYLERKMRDLRANAKTTGFERLAVLAAISVTHELMALRKRHEGEERQLGDSLAALRLKVEAALGNEPRKR
ncbi:MAG: cell division protein ZapA [Rhodanobacter sp.]